MNAVTHFLSSNLHPRRNVRNEIGLSDGYAEALGEYIGRQARLIGVKPDDPEATHVDVGAGETRITGNACGVMVVTHSRRLAEGLVRGLGAEPTFVAMRPDADTPAPSLPEWIASREERSVDDLMTLRETSLDRFRQVQGILGAR